MPPPYRNMLLLTCQNFSVNSQYDFCKAQHFFLFFSKVYRRFLGFRLHGHILSSSVAWYSRDRGSKNVQVSIFNNCNQGLACNDIPASAEYWFYFYICFVFCRVASVQSGSHPVLWIPRNSGLKTTRRQGGSPKEGRDKDSRTREGVVEAVWVLQLPPRRQLRSTANNSLSQLGPHSPDKDLSAPVSVTNVVQQ